MTKQYFYAVRKGLKVGIYNSWAAYNVKRICHFTKWNYAFI